MPLITKSDLSLGGLMRESESAAAEEMARSKQAADKAAAQAQALKQKEDLTTEDAANSIKQSNSRAKALEEIMATTISDRFQLNKVFDSIGMGGMSGIGGSNVSRP